MKLTKILSGTFFMFCFVLNVTAQESFNIHGGTSIPLSNFAEDDAYEFGAGGAKAGFNLGLKYTYPITKNGLNLMLGFDFNYNSLSQEMKDRMERAHSTKYPADYSYFKYLNFPFSFGLDYTFKIDQKTSFYTHLGQVYNYLNITDMVIKTKDRKFTVNYQTTGGFGFKVGAGLIIDNVIIGVNYLSVGTEDIKGYVKGEDETQNFNLLELNVDILKLKLGINL